MPKKLSSRGPRPALLNRSRGVALERLNGNNRTRPQSYAPVVGWGAAVIPRLAIALHNELPEVKGFSERNIKRMLAFYREYLAPDAIVPQAAAQIHSASKVPQPAAQLIDSILWSIPWFHHVILMEKVKDLSTGRWYMEQTLANGWSRNVLTLQIGAKAHVRHGKTVSNFAATLPAPQSVLDFVTLSEPFHERELETQLVRHLEAFLLALGQGFAFVGRQYRLDVGDDDFYIDLLFYHLRLRVFVVIDSKKGKFKPEYAGKLNFYCNVVNDRLKRPDDQPTIGLILCQEHGRLLAEYSFAGIDKPIGISTYELTRALPAGLKSGLPTVEEIEEELSKNPRRPRTGNARDVKLQRRKRAEGKNGKIKTVMLAP